MKAIKLFAVLLMSLLFVGCENNNDIDDTKNRTHEDYLIDFIKKCITEIESFELKFNGKITFKTTAQNDQLQIIKELFSRGLHFSESAV